jgi:hypothetical protein
MGFWAYRHNCAAAFSFCRFKVNCALNALFRANKNLVFKWLQVHFAAFAGLPRFLGKKAPASGTGEISMATTL